MEGRFVFGNRALSEQLATRIGPENIWPVQKFFQAKSDEQLTRHHRYNDTAFNLEPHIKEGPGGLRDIQTALTLLCPARLPQGVVRYSTARAQG